MRTLIRATLALSILALTIYSIGALEAQTSGAPLLAGISALLLLILLRAATVASRRHADR